MRWQASQPGWRRLICEPQTCLVVIAVIGAPAPQLVAALARFAARGAHLARQPDERLPARHEALALSCIDLKDGAILQPYDDASLRQVSVLIEAFLARGD